MTKVCVTGANGFIASHLVQQLLDAGLSVRGTVRDASAGKAGFPLKVRGCEDRLELFSADLRDEGAFDKAVRGCRTVFHVASPYLLNVQDPQRDLILPAVQGTLNVLASCLREPGVERVVLTSSVAAITDEPPDRVLSEADWNTKSTLSRNPYYLSKTLAERAAWRFVEQHNAPFRLIAINPFFVIGPSLTPTLNETNGVLAAILKGAYPGILSLAWGIVDVRDVARAHVLAMDTPGAGGRYICAGDVLTMRDLVNCMRNAGYSGPPYKLPSLGLDGPIGNGLIKMASYLRPTGVGSYLRSHIGRLPRFDNSRIRQELGIEFRTATETIRDALVDLERWGHIPPRPSD